MDDVQGYFRAHDTTPAAVMTNKIYKGLVLWKQLKHSKGDIRYSNCVVTIFIRYPLASMLL